MWLAYALACPEVRWVRQQVCLVHGDVHQTLNVGLFVYSDRPDVFVNIKGPHAGPFFIVWLVHILAEGSESFERYIGIGYPGLGAPGL